MKILICTMLLVFASAAHTQSAVPRNGNCPSGWYADGNYCILPQQTRDIRAEQAQKMEETRRHNQEVFDRKNAMERDACISNGGKWKPHSNKCGIVVH